MKKGFTLVEIMIVVAIIGLLAAIAIPSFMKARTTSQKNACINNLRQIESGKDQYAIEQGRTNGWAFANNTAAFTSLVGQAAGYIKAYPACPASSSNTVKGTVERAAGDYTANAIGVTPTCHATGDPTNSTATDAHQL